MKHLYEVASRNGWRWGKVDPIGTLYRIRKKHKMVLKGVSKHPKVFMFAEGAYQVRKVRKGRGTK